MPRTVSAALVTPDNTSLTRSEVIDTNGNGGLLPIALALNTLYEQKRVNIVSDWHDPAIVTDGGTAVYLVKPIVTDGKAQYCEVWIYIDVTNSTAGTFTATMTEAGSGDSVTYSVSAKKSGWVQLLNGVANLLVRTNGSELDLSLEISTTGTWTDSNVLGVSVFYDRAYSELPAGPYSPVDVLPIDDTWIAGERPVSVARLADCHGLAKHLVQRRNGGNFLTCCHVPSSIDDGSFPVVVPGSKGGQITATFNVYGSISVDAEITVDGVTTVFSGFHGWVSHTIVFTTPAVGNTAIKICQFANTGDGINSVCGYFADMGY